MTLSGHEEIDIELGEWLDGAQMQRAKKAEQLKTALLKAIGEQPANSSQHFRFVMLKLRKDAPRVYGLDEDGVQMEISRFVTGTEMRWPTERHWQSPASYRCTDFGEYPILAKSLASGHFDPLRFGMGPSVMASRAPVGRLRAAGRLLLSVVATSGVG